jgi:hypothetical protein
LHGLSAGCGRHEDKIRIQTDEFSGQLRQWCCGTARPSVVEMKVRSFGPTQLLQSTLKTGKQRFPALRRIGR